MNPEVKSLRMELDELRHTVHLLQGNRSWPSRLGLLAVGVVLGLIAARLPSSEAQAVQKDNKDLVCSSLKVVGPGGKHLLTLDADGDGGVLQVFGVDGSMRTRLSVANKPGSGKVELFDTKKQRMLLLGTDEDGGMMEIYGLDGKIRTSVATAPKQGGGLINLFDTKKRLRLILEATDQGAVIDKR
jgi:hypothetical protein